MTFFCVQTVDMVYDVMSKAFLVLPQFALGDGLVRLSYNYFLSSVFLRFDIETYKNPFTFDQIGWHLVALGAEGLVLFVLNLLIDSRGCAPSR